MEPHFSTPFGRRSLSLAMVASQATAKEAPPGAAVHKWRIFHAICEGKAAIGVSERALAVLDALLSFHPETALTVDSGLIVFPSNQQLSLRAHGMAPATLRRHLAALVESGLIIRRDSPNGKRYARKDRSGDIEQAFGFDLTPLVARAAEFEAYAEQVRAERRALMLARETITVCRRDIVKMIAMGVEEGAPGDWAGYRAAYVAIMGGLPRAAALAQLESAGSELRRLANEIASSLEAIVKIQKTSANESQTERHLQNSKPNNLTELEPGPIKDTGPKIERRTALNRPPQRSFPLGMVLDACPDIIDYAKGGVSDWRDLMAAAGLVRSVLGVSPSAWEEAQAAMGEEDAAAVIAAILQRGDAINSPGGYLRSLTEKAREGRFSLGPVLMALIGKRRREPKRA